MLSKVTTILPCNTCYQCFFLFHNFQYLFFPYEFNKGVKRFYTALLLVVLKKRIESIPDNFRRLFLHNLVSRQINTCTNCDRHDFPVSPNILRRAMVIGKSISGHILRKVTNTRLTITLQMGKLHSVLLIAVKVRS